MAKPTTNIRATVVGGVAYVSLADLDTWADNWLNQAGKSLEFNPETCVMSIKPSRNLPALADVLTDLKLQLLDIQAALESIRGEDHDEGDGDVPEVSVA